VSCVLHSQTTTALFQPSLNLNTSGMANVEKNKFLEHRKEYSFHANNIHKFPWPLSQFLCIGILLSILTYDVLLTFT